MAVLASCGYKHRLLLCVMFKAAHIAVNVRSLTCLLDYLDLWYFVPVVHVVYPFYGHFTVAPTCVVARRRRND